MKFKLNWTAVIGGIGAVFLSIDLVGLIQAKAWVDAIINAELILLMAYYILIYPLKPLNMTKSSWASLPFTSPWWVSKRSSNATC